MADDYETDPMDELAEPELRRPSRASRFMAKIKKWEEEEKREQQAGLLTPELETRGLEPTTPVVIPDKHVIEGRIGSSRAPAQEGPDQNTEEGRLLAWIRKGEFQLSEDAKNVKSVEDLQAFYDHAERVADFKTELYERIRKKTLDDRKAGKLDAQAFNERFSMLVGDKGEAGMKAELESLRKQIAEGRAQAAEQKTRMATQSAAKTETPGFLKPYGKAGELAWSAGELAWSAMESSPVKGILNLLNVGMELTAAVGSSAVSGLAELGLAEQPRAGRASLDEVVASFGPRALDEDAPWRKRGRDFLAEAGENMALLHEQRPVVSALANPFDGSMRFIDTLEAVDILKPGQASQYRALSQELLVGAAIDPLNVLVEAAAPIKSLKALEKTLYANRTFLKFAEKYPKVAYAPGKFIRYATGHAKAAQALGDERLTRVMLTETMMADTAGKEFAQLRHDWLKGEAELVKPLKGDQLKQFANDLPGMVERGKDARMAIRETADDPYSKILLDAADWYDDMAARQHLLETKWGMNVRKLDGPYAYFQREYSDELVAWLNKRPNAQKEMFGFKVQKGRDGLLGALENWERGRKYADETFYEAEQKLREMFRKHGLKDDVPIWSRDHFKDMAKRSTKSWEAVQARGFGLNFVQEFATPHSQTIIDDMMKAWSKLERPPAPPASSVEGLEEGVKFARQYEAKASKEAAEASREAARATAAANTAERQASQARKAYQDATEGVEKAQAARKQAKDDYFKAQDEFNKGGAGQQAANESMQDAVRRLKKAEAELKAAKATAKDPETVARLEKEVADAEQSVGAAKGRQAAAQERFGKAQEAAAKAEAEARDWEQKAAQARAEWAEHARRAQGKNPDNWSPDAKAAWVRQQIGPTPPGEAVPLNALDALLQLRVPLPDDIGELARLGSSWLSPDDAKIFRKYVENHYWRRLPKNVSALGEWWDDWKRIFQKSSLARFASATKDNIGTVAQMMLSGNLAHLPGAIRDLGGTPWKWASGAYKASDDVAMLEARGVLQTTISETTEAASGKGLLRGTIGKYGVLGTLARPFGEEAARKVAGFTDQFIHERQWVEAVGRLATYRKAIAEGASVEDAIADVYTHWGKMDELTKLERTKFNRAFFFWAWKARSIPITAAMFLEHPVRMRLLLMATVGDMRGDQGQDMPEWLKRMGGWILDTDDEGNVQVASTGGSMYSSPTIGFLQGDMMKALQSGQVYDVPGLALRETFRSSPPFLQSAAELAFQHDYFTNQDWWKDPENKTGSNMKAPSFMFHLMNPNARSAADKTALQKLFGLEAEYDSKTHDLRRVTMNPYWAWLLDALPGVSPLMGDVSAFVDPRGGGMLPGMSRQFGVPIYHVPKPDRLGNNIREIRKALQTDVDKLSSGALVYEYGRIGPNVRNVNGQRLKQERDTWREEAKAQKLGPAQTRAYIEERMKRFWLDEWRLYELADRLEVLKALAEGEDRQEKTPAETAQGLGLPGEDRYRKQATREAERDLARRRAALGLR